MVRNVPRVLTGNGPTRHRLERHPRWNPNPSYPTVHKRLARYRGPAKQYDCACGCGRQALDWAYIGPREPFGMRTPYSANIWDDYIPMTRECHKGADMEYLRHLENRPRRRQGGPTRG